MGQHQPLSKGWSILLAKEASSQRATGSHACAKHPTSAIHALKSLLFRVNDWSHKTRIMSVTVFFGFFFSWTIFEYCLNEYYCYIIQSWSNLNIFLPSPSFLDIVAWKRYVSERRTRSTVLMRREPLLHSTRRKEARERTRSSEISGRWFTRKSRRENEASVKSVSLKAILHCGVNYIITKQTGNLIILMSRLSSQGIFQLSPVGIWTGDLLPR